MKGLHAWKALGPRDRLLLKVAVVFLVGALLFQSLWQPGRQRLASAERYEQQQRLLARQLDDGQPQRGVRSPSRPLASTVNDSAEAAGLKVAQIEMEDERLRVSLSGEALAVLDWLVQLERDAGPFQTLIVEKHGTVLEARLEL